MSRPIHGFTAKVNDLRQILCFALRVKPLCFFVQFSRPDEMAVCVCMAAKASRRQNISPETAFLFQAALGSFAAGRYMAAYGKQFQAVFLTHGKQHALRFQAAELAGRQIGNHANLLARK